LDRSKGFHEDSQIFRGKRAIETVGGRDLVVNNAGPAHAARSASTSGDGSGNRE
jgi:hypothetical protein